MGRYAIQQWIYGKLVVMPQSGNAPVPPSEMTQDSQDERTYYEQSLTNWLLERIEIEVDTVVQKKPTRLACLQYLEEHDQDTSTGSSSQAYAEHRVFPQASPSVDSEQCVFREDTRSRGSRWDGHPLITNVISTHISKYNKLPSVPYIINKLRARNFHDVYYSDIAEVFRPYRGKYEKEQEERASIQEMGREARDKMRDGKSYHCQANELYLAELKRANDHSGHPEFCRGWIMDAEEHVRPQVGETKTNTEAPLADRFDILMRAYIKKFGSKQWTDCNAAQLRSFAKTKGIDIDYSDIRKALDKRRGD